MEKKFEIPELIIVYFYNDDIMTASGPGGDPADTFDENDDF